jgi:hypothetical protein
MRYVAAALLAALGGNEYNYFSRPFTGITFFVFESIKTLRRGNKQNLCPDTALMANRMCASGPLLGP